MNDTDKAERKTEQAIDSVIAEGGVDQPADSNGQASVNQKSSGSRVFMFLLLVVALILAGLAAGGQLQPLYEKLMAGLNDTRLDDTQSVDTQQKGLQADNEPTVGAQREPLFVAPEIDTPPVTTETGSDSGLESIGASVQSTGLSEEVSKLHSTIYQLRLEMRDMILSQRALQDGLIEQQQMNVQVRLRWIADPASRLSQVQLAWEEISLLPGLTDAQRTEATDMHSLARSNVQKLKQWQAELKQWADALSTPVHQNIMPEPEHPWLAWIVSQFQLRQAPSLEANRLAHLRNRLLESARRLTLESWPDAGKWQSLHAELLLQIKAMQDQAEDVRVDIGLPDNFEPIQSDISMLRQTAQAWSHAGQQGGEL